MRSTGIEKKTLEEILDQNIKTKQNKTGMFSFLEEGVSFFSSGIS